MQVSHRGVHLFEATLVHAQLVTAGALPGALAALAMEKGIDDG